MPEIAKQIRITVEKGGNRYIAWSNLDPDAIFVGRSWAEAVGKVVIDQWDQLGIHVKPVTDYGTNIVLSMERALPDVIGNIRAEAQLTQERLAKGHVMYR